MLSVILNVLSGGTGIKTLVPSKKPPLKSECKNHGTSCILVLRTLEMKNEMKPPCRHCACVLSFAQTEAKLC